MAARKAKYPGAHDRERKRWKLLIEAGGVACSRGCGRMILPGRCGLGSRYDPQTRISPRVLDLLV